MKRNLLKVFTVGLACCFYLLLDVSFGFASSVVDQQYVPTDNYSSAYVSGYDYDAQTFTAGVSGNLTQIDLFLSRDRNHFDYGMPENIYDLKVEVVRLNSVQSVPETNNNVNLNMSPLGTITIPYANVPIVTNGAAWFSVDFSSLNACLVEGTTYAIVLSGDAPSWNGIAPFYWYGGMDEPNYNGDFYHRQVPNETSWRTDSLKLPRGFKTYVDTSTVPIPAGIWLLGSSILGLVGLRKKIKG